MTRRLVVALAAAFMVMASLPAAGAPSARTLAAMGCQTIDNLVQNCGFESGLTSWTLSDSTNSGVVSDGETIPWEGTAAFAGASDPASDTDVVTLTQTFTPSAGVAYLASFQHNRGDTTASGGWLEATITYGSTTVHLAYLGSFDTEWTEHTELFVGTGETATLTFRIHLRADVWYVDGVSVAPFPATVPDAPTMNPEAAVAQGPGLIGMNWVASDYEGGLELRGFNVYAGTASGEEDYTAPLNGATLITDAVFNAVGLTGGQTYYFTVTQVNDLGESLPSGETSATAIDLADAPTSLEAIAGDGSVTLSWTAPANDGGAPISFYGYYIGDSAETLEYMSWFASGSATSGTVTGLENGRTYWFAVGVTNSMGRSGPSEAVSATPFRPLTAPLAPDAWVEAVGNGWVTVTWTAPVDDGGSAITGYNVYRCLVYDCETRANATLLSPTTFSFTVDSLVADGSRYYFYVTAVNTIGESEQAGGMEAVPLLVPDAPIGLTAQPTVTGRRMSVELTWSNGVSAVGIDSYVISVYEFRAPNKRNPEGSYRLLRATYDATSQSYVIPDMSSGKSYAFSVTAHNAVGWSDASAYSNIVP